MSSKEFEFDHRSGHQLYDQAGCGNTDNGLPGGVLGYMDGKSSAFELNTNIELVSLFPWWIGTGLPKGSLNLPPTMSVPAGLEYIKSTREQKPLTGLFAFLAPDYNS